MKGQEQVGLCVVYRNTKGDLLGVINSTPFKIPIGTKLTDIAAESAKRADVKAVSVVKVASGEGMLVINEVTDLDRLPSDILEGAEVVKRFNATVGSREEGRVATWAIVDPSALSKEQEDLVTGIAAKVDAEVAAVELGLEAEASR